VLPFTDFEQLGYETALQSRDQVAEEQICALHIHAFGTNFNPEVSDLDSRIDTNRARTSSFHSHLYDRPVPAGDAAMLARDHAVPPSGHLGCNSWNRPDHQPRHDVLFDRPGCVGSHNLHQHAPSQKSALSYV
jgi:hypothetical protein